QSNMCFICLRFIICSPFLSPLSSADPFVYNYERLRIGGLIIAGLLVAGGLFVLLNPKCTRKNK
uniref:FXYD domain-containing ion transport regulator n=1 Tax=Salmo trutta TaxID=8032 RepID=A0A673Z6S0_SALTR